MGYNEYAKTKQKINRLGFGAWQLGNTEFWGYMAIEDGVELVQHAIKRGINFFDTAPGYASGLSETILGMATKNFRSKVVINTKLGHTADGETDFSVFSLRKQIEDSLDRLQSTYLDSVILHNPGFDILEGKTQHVQELKALKEEGLIRAYGVSIDTYEELEAVINHLEVDVVEILFNIFFQEPAKLFHKAKKKGISLIAKVPLDSGWLTGKYDEHSEFTGIRMRWDDQTIERRASLVKELKEMTKDDTLTKYAIGFILSYPEITAVIPGMRNINQVDDHLMNADYVLPQELKDQFKKLYEEKIKKDPLPW